MNDSEILTSVVVLEAMWAKKHKDLLDLIMPFVQYAAIKTSTDESFVNTIQVTNYMRTEFGYVDIPEAVIIKVLKRDREHFFQRNKKIVCKKSLTSQEQLLNAQKEQGKKKIDAIVDALFPYLQSHCIKSKGISREWTVDMLLKFMANFGIQIGFENLETKHFSLKSQEIEYYISMFVFEEKEKKSLLYDYILSVVKGFLLKSVIYFQIDNADLMKSSYKNLKIFYDTPFLINLLAFQSDDEYRAAEDLHKLLKKQGASFYYFPQTRKEIERILYAYQNSRKGSYRTLEGLDNKSYDYSGVERLKQRWQSTLISDYGVLQHDLPEYKKDNNGFVDGDRVRISEKELAEYIKNNTPHYSDENLQSDAASIIAIENLRDGFVSSTIEKCVAIFVTTNIDLTKAIKKYYKKNRLGGVLPVITSFDLSAIAWVKNGSISQDIPENQLLVNSYMAMQPSSEIIKKCRDVLDQLEHEGKITAEDALMLRADKVTQKELWKSEFPLPQDIDESYIQRLSEKHKERLITEDRKHKEDEQIKSINKQAKEYAERQRDVFFKCELILVYGVITILFALGFWGLIKSFSGSKMSIFTIAYLVASVLSLFDTFSGRTHFIRSWLQKIAFHFESWIREKKYNEWMTISGFSDRI